MWRSRDCEDYQPLCAHDWPFARYCPSLELTQSVPSAGQCCIRAKNCLSRGLLNNLRSDGCPPTSHTLTPTHVTVGRLGWSQGRLSPLGSSIGTSSTPVLQQACGHRSRALCSGSDRLTSDVKTLKVSCGMRLGLMIEAAECVESTLISPRSMAEL